MKNTERPLRMVLCQNDWILWNAPTFSRSVLWEQHHHQNHPSSRLIRAASFADRMPLVCHGSAGWSEGRLEKNMWCSCKLSVKSHAHFLCTKSRPSQPNKKYEKSSRNALQRSSWAETATIVTQELYMPTAAQVTHIIQSNHITHFAHITSHNTHISPHHSHSGRTPIPESPRHMHIEEVASPENRKK